MTGPFYLFPMDVDEEVPAPPAPAPMDIEEPQLLPVPPNPFLNHPLPHELIQHPLPPLPPGLGPIQPVPDHLFDHDHDFFEPNPAHDIPAVPLFQGHGGLDISIRFNTEFEDLVRQLGYNNYDLFFRDLNFDEQEEHTFQAADGTVFNIHYEVVHRSDNEGYHISSPDFHGHGYYYFMF